MESTFAYIIGNHGIEAASTYPLFDVQYPCHFNSSFTAANMSSFGFIEGDEEHLKQALAAIGPLSIGISATVDSFFFYWNGIYDDETCDNGINHAVTLIGYDTDFEYDPPVDYWIIKNSWSSYWGESGFMRLKRGSNLCGLGQYTTYPIV